MTSTNALTRPPNRLAAESSPYLIQHAHNPVDWFPWGPEAFEKARREDRPIFLSIGYSACHWCHVMERESFENEEIAGILNERFVSIKVDREERPDVDDIYMTAVQMTTGRGGWPLSSFLLPDGKPFFAGTYFPPEDRHGRAGFKTVLLRLSEAFRERRPDLEETATRIAEGIAEGARSPSKKSGDLDEKTLELLSASLAQSFDPTHGGFGSAPKFPPHVSLDWLLVRGAAGDAASLALATATLDAMALGGIHDHLAGGFHRYSTDERWLVPHFEKMLTDNAQLLGVYARAFRVTGRDLYRKTARGIADYLLREMRGPEGAFYAATDADSEGEEGRFFVFSEAEIVQVLGVTEAAFFGRHYGVRADGNFNDESTGRPTGLNILHLSKEPTAVEETRLALLREKLLEKRLLRVSPALDDKRLAGWNALAVSGLAVASQCLSEPKYLQAAREAARFLLVTARDESGRLLRSWKGGQGKILAFLEDEAFLANALLDLAEADAGAADHEWLAAAERAVHDLRQRFRRPGEPGFTFTGEGHEALLARPRDLFDKAIPSGSASAVRALVRLALRRVSGHLDLAREARAALQDVGVMMSRAPHGTESWYLALRDLLVYGGERVTGAGSKTRTEAHSGPVTLAGGLSSPGSLVRPGDSVEAVMNVSIEKAYTLMGYDGLKVEAWGGSDIVVASIHKPAPFRIKHQDGSVDLGYSGTVAVRLRFDLALAATAGERILSIVVRYRACGQEACLPVATVALTVPFTVS
jgi:hypothetical protein